MELNLPDYARNLANAMVALVKNLSMIDDKTILLFNDVIKELNLLFSPVAHPFFANTQFSEMFTDWKSMYLRTKEMLPEQQKINILRLAKLSENDVDKATAILEKAIRYKFLDLVKSFEKMPNTAIGSQTNIPLQSHMVAPKVVEMCQNPNEILAAHKFTIHGKKIRCETVPTERAIALRAQLTGYTITFTPNLDVN